jgi:hypothetical protein
MTCLATAHFIASQLDLAHEIGRRAEELARTLKERGSEAWTLALLAAVRAQQHAFTAAQLYANAAQTSY